MAARLMRDPFLDVMDAYRAAREEPRCTDCDEFKAVCVCMDEPVYTHYESRGPDEA